MYSKPNFITALILPSIGALLFLIFFVLCVNSYFSFDINYSDLTYDELTYERYFDIDGYKRGTTYAIRFKEYQKSFKISNIAKNGMDKDALAQLKENDSVKVYYRESTDEQYQYEICEMKSGDITVLSLSDYIEVNKRNQKIGMITCPIMSFLCISLVFIYLHLAKKLKVLKNEPNELGIVRIEYTADGNLIQVFNSVNACSLVINGKITDQYFGLVSTPFTLKGYATSNESEIPVEAKMGHLNMRLYYNGNVVAKEFMGLG